MRKMLGYIAVALFAAACADSINSTPTGPRPGGRASLDADPLPGAIFTTDQPCAGNDLNIYNLKSDVYIDGGPAHPGAAGLPDGYYWVKVTSPDGTVLGTSATAIVHVTNGEFDQCYQLSSILLRASNGQPGYDDTPNNGGEYKVWVSTTSNFIESESKTDNFKVKERDTPCPDCVFDVATLNVVKFYDANANGLNDDGQTITGWKVNIHDGINVNALTPVALSVAAPDDYTVTEYDPIQLNWSHTTATQVLVSVAPGDDKTVYFGNVCVGAGGGLTLGFWSNKNGQALIGADDIAMLVALNLRNADGSNFDPTTNAGFRTWILSATATNMAYMLSAQLAAMELNVFNNKVNGTSLIYAPGTTSANALGFATVNDVMAEANASLGTDGLTNVAGPTRTYQEALKNALDNANNNLSFVQGTPCAFSFAAP